MKKYILVLVLLLVAACGSSGSAEMDTKLTAENRDQIMQTVMPEMSKAEQTLVLGYLSRKMQEQMVSEAAVGSNPTPPAGGEWALLPEGQSVNEIIAEEKQYEAEHTN